MASGTPAVAGGVRRQTRARKACAELLANAWSSDRLMARTALCAQHSRHRSDVARGLGDAPCLVTLTVRNDLCTCGRNPCGGRSYSVSVIMAGCVTVAFEGAARGETDSPA